MVQADVHAAYGGVVPNLAMEAHKAAMDSCVENSLQQAGITAQDLSAVAVSIGPGLSPCLQVCPCIYLAGFAPGSPVQLAASNSGALTCLLSMQMHSS